MNDNEQLTAVSLWGFDADLSIPERIWRRMLVLAERYGWQPAGTESPEETWVEAGALSQDERLSWRGDYYPGRGQVLTEMDAHELAIALERALPDLPARDPKDRGEEADLCDVWNLHEPDSKNLLDGLSGPNRKFVKMFILHCRECSHDGGFWITPV